MGGHGEELLKINTNRYAFYVLSDYTNLKNEIKDIEQKAENVVDWIINTKKEIKSLPISMRKFAAYAVKLTKTIMLIPLVLRKRYMYDRIMNG